MPKPIITVPIAVLAILILIRISPFSALLVGKGLGFFILPACAFGFVAWVFMKYDFPSGFFNHVGRFMFLCSVFWIWAVLDLILNTRQLFEEGISGTSFVTHAVLLFFVFMFVLFVAQEKGEPSETKSKEPLKEIDSPAIEESEITLEEKIVHFSTWDLLKPSAFIICVVAFAFYKLPSDSSVIESQQQEIFFKSLVDYGVWWLCIIFFGLVGLYLIKRLFDKKPALIISSLGITDNTTAVSKGFIPWKDVESIHSSFIFNQKSIVVNVKNPEKYLDNQNLFSRFISKANTKLVGGHIVIVCSALDIDYIELLKILKRNFLKFRKR